jgi:hypothetical protein
MQDESSPESIEHNPQHGHLQKDRTLLTSESSGGDGKKLSSALASVNSILGHQWIEPDEQEIHFEGFEGFEGIDFHTMDPFPNWSEDDLFGGTFSFPGGPRMT